MLRSAGLIFLVVFPVFQILVIKHAQSFPIAAYLQKFHQYLLKIVFFKLAYIRNKSLAFIANGILQYQYIITALKIIICGNIVCFCLQTSEIYLELRKI